MLGASDLLRRVAILKLKFWHEMMPRFHSALAPLVTIALAGAVRSPAHVRLAQGGIAPSAPFIHRAARPRPTLVASAVPAAEEEGGEEELLQRGVVRAHRPAEERMVW